MGLHLIAWAIRTRLPRWPSGFGVRLESGRSRVRIPLATRFFPGSSHTSDFKNVIGTPVATLPGAWQHRVSAGTGWTIIIIIASLNAIIIIVLFNNNNNNNNNNIIIIIVVVVVTSRCSAMTGTFLSFAWTWRCSTSGSHTWYDRRQLPTRGMDTCMYQWVSYQCRGHRGSRHPGKLPWGLFVGWLVNAPATCECISGTDLLRQVYVLPHWDRSCRSNFPSHLVTVYWHQADQSQHWPYNARRLAG